MSNTYEYHIDLKCCPFCGGVAWLENVEFPDGDVYFNPQCSKCEAGWMCNCETKQEAIEVWNMRKEVKND
jgi:hypothetical protein